jgi:hypothetical protein
VGIAEGVGAVFGEHRRAEERRFRDIVASAVAGPNEAAVVIVAGVLGSFDCDKLQRSGWDRSPFIRSFDFFASGSANRSGSQNPDSCGLRPIHPAHASWEHVREKPVP